MVNQLGFVGIQPGVNLFPPRAENPGMKRRILPPFLEYGGAEFAGLGAGTWRPGSLTIGIAQKRIDCISLRPCGQKAERIRELVRAVFGPNILGNLHHGELHRRGGLPDIAPMG